MSDHCGMSGYVRATCRGRLALSECNCEKSTTSNCRSACATQDHLSFGECARAADIQIDRASLKGD